jgi:hypothetical protein
MAIPDPSPGLVVRCHYVWARQAAIGHTQGKNRPACIVVASDDARKPRFVVLLPITHSAPREHDVAVEIPAKVRQSIGLDEGPAWIVVSEHNVDEWPSTGLSPVPGRPGEYCYGFIPPGLFARVKAQFIEVAATARSATVIRQP